MTADANSIFQNKPSVDAMSAKLGFDIPVELVSLPSCGKLYPKEHPFCDADGVEVRSMTAREEDLLTSRALIKAGTVISKLIESCLVQKGVPVDSLLSGDRNALLIAIRIIGYGPEHKVKVECPDCEQTFDHTFHLDNLRVQRLGDEPIAPYTNLFAFKLPLSGLSVQYRLMTEADERELSQSAERRKKIGGMQETSVTTRLLAAIHSINGETDRTKLATIVSNLRAGDSRALRSHMAKVEPQIDMNQEMTCKHCGVSSEVSVPLGASFFWPS